MSIIQQDLEKSGIAQQIITAAGLREITPEDFREKSGYGNIPCEKVLEIPYYGESGKILLRRWKIYPTYSYRNGDGKERKISYLQPKGKRTIPYIPALTLTSKNKSNIPLWHTEGEKKALKLCQHGVPTIALPGVWNFRGRQEEAGLAEEITGFELKGRTNYLCFDSDLWVNPSVRSALYEYSLRLISFGAIVKVVTWDPSQGKGIDDHLVNREEAGQKAEDVIHQLENKAKNLEDFFNSDHEEAMIRALAYVDLDPIPFSRLVNKVVKKLGVEKKVLLAVILQRKNPVKPEETTESEKAEAMKLLQDPGLIERFLNLCHKEYLGRDEELILIKLATVSRYFDRGIPVVIKGTSSVGKSKLIETVLKTLPGEAKEDFTRISENYLLYRKDPIENKVLTFYELYGAGSTAGILRNAITEGVLKIGTVLKDAQGILSTADICKGTKGLVVLSTFASGVIDHELETRVILIEISHDQSLAREVLRQKAAGRKTEDKEYYVWRTADKLLKPGNIIIPFAGKLADVFPVGEERYMRDFDKVKSLIQASSFLHQYQRERTEDGSIIADRRDYELVYRLRGLISQTVSHVGDQLLHFLKKAKEIGEPTRAEMEKVLSKSEKTLQRYVKEAKNKELIETEGRGRKVKIKVVSIPEPVSPLPTPEEIFYNSPVVQMSNFKETLMNTEKELDKVECLTMSKCLFPGENLPPVPTIKLDKVNIFD